MFSRRKITRTQVRGLDATMCHPLPDHWLTISISSQDLPWGKTDDRSLWQGVALQFGARYSWKLCSDLPTENENKGFYFPWCLYFIGMSHRSSRKNSWVLLVTKGLYMVLKEMYRHLRQRRKYLELKVSKVMLWEIEEGNGLFSTGRIKPVIFNLYLSL